MERIKKELKKRGIIGASSEIEIYRTGIDCERTLVGIENGFIIIAVYTNVLPTHFDIYDMNFNPIATQDLERDDHSFGFEFNPWSVGFYESEVWKND